MFATLLGSLPRPPAGSIDDAIRIAIRAQEDAGLEPITDGRLADLADPATPALDRWRVAAGLTDRAVKQVLTGPYTAVRGGSDGHRGSNVRRGRNGRRRSNGRRTIALAAALRREIEALADAGCPLIEIEETEAYLIGEDEAERQLFREAHGRLTEGVTGTHLSLSIVGGSAWSAGAETILDAPYASLAVDLVAGPDNWNLVTRLAGDRGVIAGALPAGASPADSKEMLLWAARYAASSNGRGVARVGLGSAGSWASLTWDAAVAKMQRLGEAARLASMPPGEGVARSLDPRAVSARHAALGHDAPPPRRRRRGPDTLPSS